MVREDDSLSETAARLQVTRRDGKRLEAEHDLLAPMPLSQREERVRAKAATLIGADVAGQVWTLLNAGGRAGDLGAFIAADSASARPDFV